MIEGLFVVLEGVDGAGTTTHTGLLARALRKKGLPITTTREPSDGPIGMLIRQILTGRVVVPGISGNRPSSWTTMALLFGADRMDHLEATVHPNLMDGVTVISDRYDYSSVAYQSVTGGGEPETVQWIREINRHARRPDLTIVLDVDPATSAKRRNGCRITEVRPDPTNAPTAVATAAAISSERPSVRSVASTSDSELTSK